MRSSLKSNRLSILNKHEFDDLYGLPKFSKDDRVHFLALNDEEIAFLNRLLKPHLKAYFLLQLGFFKAKNRFFDIDLSKHYQDLRYIKLHFLNGAQIATQQPNKNSKSRYRAKILELTGSQASDEKAKRATKKFAKTSARRNLKPRAIFAEILDFLRSIYLLDYIDNENLRQDVQLVQNRAEAYHRLRRAISNIAGGKFQGASAQEVEVWNECGRLLTNCIIYYNTDLLSRLVEQVDDSTSHTFRKISPVAWQHINFLGKYEFREEATKLDLDQMVSNIDISEFLKAA